MAEGWRLEASLLSSNLLKLTLYYADIYGGKSDSFSGGIMNNILKKENGFSLVEILVAIFILGAALVPIFIMFSEGISLTARSTELNLAVNSAQDKMEEIRNMTHNSITIGTWPDEEIAVGERDFIRHVTVAESGIVGAGGNLKKITVEVFWSHEDTTHSTSLVTYRCNKLEE